MTDRKLMVSNCLSCSFRRMERQIPEDAPEETRLRFIQKIMEIIAGVDPTVSSPELSVVLQDLYDETFGARMDYASIRSFFNKKIMALEHEIAEEIRRADDPLLRAVQYSMCGNYIDYSVPQKVTEEKLKEILGSPGKAEVPPAVWQSILEELGRTKELVYLLDNCGEIVLDKLVIAELKEIYPDMNITAFVRGGEALNDALMADAEEVGLTEVADVIPNGDRSPGTALGRISEEARRKLFAADLIWAKGQGNYETLHGCGLNIYYFFLCKCPYFAGLFEVPQNSAMVIHEEGAA